MKNKAAKQKSKRKGSENAFGCDLTEHLQSSGQDVPQVLKTCAEFIEKHGIVDGIYRLSGITSNIQRLRQEFISKLRPDLTREVYLQDIHCVGSLCKLYFRELPNPLLTYELYKKFMDAVSVKEEDEQLQRIQNVIKELPPSHYRTLEYLTKHLARLATFSSKTNMHARNLALVWAPNLLRSKEIEVPTCNGDIAFLEVRVQQSVVEFILNHTEQIFNHRAGPSLPEEGKSLVCETKCASLPASSQCLPMKLMSLEEAQARSLDQNHPARKDHQWMNSLPDKSAAALDYKIIDLPDCKRKFSGKSRKWKSIFNLGRSVTDSKGKLSRNGSVFVRAQKLSEKAPIRPTKSMDSLCSLSTEDNDRESKFRRPSEGNGFFTPAFKSHTLGSGSIYDLTKEGHEFEPEILLGATGVSPSVSRTGKKSGTTPLQKALPEQLKVFKGDDLNNCQPTSPKNRRMLYSCNTSNGSSKPSFPGSLFPLESSPRHQHKALNISEPFAVSVPLRVSAVISSNSTPCRAPGKDKAVFPPLQPMRCSNDSSNSYVSMGKEDWNAGAESEREAVCTTTEAAEGHNTELRGCRGTVVTSEPQQQLLLNTKEKTNEPSGALHPSAQASMQPISSTTSRNTETREDLTSIQPSSLHAAEFTKPPRLENLLTQQFELEELIQPDKTEELWPFTHLELKIIEPDIDIVKDKSEADSLASKNTNNVLLKQDSHARRRSSFPTYPVLSVEHSYLTSKNLQDDPQTGNPHCSSLRDIPERLFSFDGDFNVSHQKNLKQGSENQDLTQPTSILETKLKLSPLGECKETDKEPLHVQQSQSVPCKYRDEVLGFFQKDQVTKKNSDNVTDVSTAVRSLCASVPEGHKEAFGKHDKQEENIGACQTGEKTDQSVEFRGGIRNSPKPKDERPKSLEIPDKDEEDTWGDNSGGLDLVEPWEDYSTMKQWVTSPLHSPKTLDFLPKSEKLSSFSVGENYFFNKPNITLPVKGNEIVSDEMHTDVSTVPSRGNNFLPYDQIKQANAASLEPLRSKRSEIYEETKKILGIVKDKSEQKNNLSSQKFHKQKTQDSLNFEKIKENTIAKHSRPYSLTLDLGTQFIKETSVQQNLDFFLPDISFTQVESVTPSETKDCSSAFELEMFLTDHRAAIRRNSAPVSVSSIRTSYMIKTCQAKAVPVIPPKIQYSRIPQPLQVKNSQSYPEKEVEKVLENSQKVDVDTLPALPSIRCTKEETENNKPVTKIPKQTSMCDSVEVCKVMPPSDQPVLRRKCSSKGDASRDSFRFDRSTIIQRQSFRNRPNRPQSLILFSPPFPIMDYPPLGDEGRLILSPTRNPNETSKLYSLNKEVDDKVRSSEAEMLQNKMTMPKSGQRLETSTSCFYQPQRESVIFESRSNRQID